MVDHDTQVGEYSRLMPGVNIGGHIVIGKRATVGIGASVIEEIVIGDDAFVSGESVVIKDVAESTLVLGVPAKAIKKISSKIKK